MLRSFPNSYPGGHEIRQLVPAEPLCWWRPCGLPATGHMRLCEGHTEWMADIASDIGRGTYEDDDDAEAARERARINTDQDGGRQCW